MTMALQAGVGTRSAMALYADLADSTASADNAYAHAEPTISHMDERQLSDRWRGRGATSRHIVPSDGAARGAAQWLKTAYAECTRDS